MTGRFRRGASSLVAEPDVTESSSWLGQTTNRPHSSAFGRFMAVTHGQPDSPPDPALSQVTSRTEWLAKA
jgi:hypothetical protein